MNHSILGARGKITDPESTVKRINEWSRSRKAHALAVDARAVFGRDHIESAARHAERAQASRTMSSRTLEMETLLYLSGRRQVVDAIRSAGLLEGTDSIGLIVWHMERPDDLVRLLGWRRDDQVLDSAGKSLEVLGVTKTEQGTVREIAAADLALERVALLDVTK